MFDFARAASVGLARRHASARQRSRGGTGGLLRPEPSIAARSFDILSSTPGPWATFGAPDTPPGVLAPGDNAVGPAAGAALFSAAFTPAPPALFATSLQFLTTPHDPAGQLTSLETRGLNSHNLFFAVVPLPFPFSRPCLAGYRHLLQEEKDAEGFFINGRATWVSGRGCMCVFVNGWIGAAGLAAV